MHKQSANKPLYEAQTFRAMIGRALFYRDSTQASRTKLKQCEVNGMVRLLSLRANGMLAIP